MADTAIIEEALRGFLTSILSGMLGIGVAVVIVAIIATIAT